ncbi:hypothetical protein [Brevundimonas sp.]|uniref:hypothetical protein n=1 Tax=Brevundimonas sp. TaxID=1871086 RepID=UPI0028AE1B9E|nr:hypothetical protein [Brevundimonas sp.]
MNEGSKNISDEAERPVPTQPALVRSARLLMAFLERNRQERRLRYPFSLSYPHNCCESASLTFIYLLEEKYGLSDVLLFMGANSRDERHFWVGAGNCFYDLTAHQFPGHEPVIGNWVHELALDEFPDWSIAARREIVDRARVIELYRSGVIPF